MAAGTTTSRAPDGRFLLSHPAHFIALGFGSGLAPRAPGIFPEKIERDRTDCCVEQTFIIDRMLFAPESDEGVLNDVLGVCDRADELAGEKDEPRPEFRETDFPIFFMSDDIFHDLFTVF